MVWIWLVALVLGFGLFNEFFLTVMNMQNIMVRATVLGMLGLAVALPLLVAEIDLSIPANLGFSSAIGALAYSNLGLPRFPAMLAGIAVATLIGFFNGLCITKLRMVSLIQTLSMMIILQGALTALTQGKTLTNLSDGYVWIGQASVAGWPVMPLIFVVALIAIGVLLRMTILGRSIYAVGGNPQASNSAGIRVDRIKIIAYTLSGFLAGVAGFLLASWQMAITSNRGSSYLLCNRRTNHRRRQRFRRAWKCGRHSWRCVAPHCNSGRAGDHQYSVLLCRHDWRFHDLHCRRH